MRRGKARREAQKGGESRCGVALRYALSAFAGTEVPFSARRVRQWVARLKTAGILGRMRFRGAGDSWVWVTRRMNGLKPPDLLRQSARHEVAIAAVSARYLGQGYRWARDDKRDGWINHRADGVARRAGWKDLIEVELTPKTPSRYEFICVSHRYRIQEGEMSRIVYLCMPAAERAVRRAADRWMPVEYRGNLVTLPVFDELGLLAEELNPLWTPMTNLVIGKRLEGLQAEE